MTDRSLPRTFVIAVRCTICFLAVLPLKLMADDDLEPFRATLSVDRSEVQIAEALTLTIRAAAPADWEIVPPPEPVEPNGWRVIDSHDATERAEGGVTWTKRLTLEAYEPGRKILGPIEIGFQPSAHDAAPSDTPQTKTLRTEEIAVGVRSALRFLESGSELRPIDDAVAVPWTWREWLLAATCLGVATVCATLAVRWVNRFHDERASGRTSPPKLLLRDLYRLRQAWLTGRCGDADTVAKASEIARLCLGWRERRTTVHRTTDEWASSVGERGESTEGSLVDLLRLADRVKFASAEPTIDEVRLGLEQVRRAVGAQRVRT